jgi:pimeloyl-ACP methyl ester carboxylesterase
MSRRRSIATRASHNPPARETSVLLWTIAALAATAGINHLLTSRANRRYPPTGQFVEIDGLKLHYLERGGGDALVLLHGNGSMIQDFASSGLIDLASEQFRVITFDRPGFGHSDRSSRFLSPAAQAEIIYKALIALGISRATVLGHSWGASVAIALGLSHPETVSSLVLASGYYYPTARADVLAMGAPAIPVIGDIMSHTISPLVARLIWPAMLRKIFGPKDAPSKFGVFPKDLAVRPSQLRASAAESAMMIPDAFAYARRYGELKMPVTIVAGEEDRLVKSAQASKLHRQITQSSLHLIAGHGHMVHQTATGSVLMAIYEAAGVTP